MYQNEDDDVVKQKKPSLVQVVEQPMYQNDDDNDAKKKKAKAPVAIEQEVYGYDNDVVPADKRVQEVYGYNNSVVPDDKKITPTPRKVQQPAPAPQPAVVATMQEVYGEDEPVQKAAEPPKKIEPVPIVVKSLPLPSPVVAPADSSPASYNIEAIIKDVPVINAHREAIIVKAKSIFSKPVAAKKEEPKKAARASVVIPPPEPVVEQEIEFPSIASKANVFKEVKAETQEDIIKKQRESLKPAEPVKADTTIEPQVDTSKTVKPAKKGSVWSAKKAKEQAAKPVNGPELIKQKADNLVSNFTPAELKVIEESRAREEEVKREHERAQAEIAAREQERLKADQEQREAEARKKAADAEDLC